MTRLRAVFDLRPFSKNNMFKDLYPPGAMRASNAALKGLLYVQKGLKDKRGDIGKWYFMTQSWTHH